MFISDDCVWHVKCKLNVYVLLFLFFMRCICWCLFKCTPTYVWVHGACCVCLCWYIKGHMTTYAIVVWRLSTFFIIVSLLNATIARFCIISSIKYEYFKIYTTQHCHLLFVCWYFASSIPVILSILVCFYAHALHVMCNTCELRACATASFHDQRSAVIIVCHIWPIASDFPDIGTQGVDAAKCNE